MPVLPFRKDSPVPRLDVHEHEGDKYVIISESNQLARLKVITAVLVLALVVLGYLFHQQKQMVDAKLWSLNKTLSKIQGEEDAGRSLQDHN